MPPPNGSLPTEYLAATLIVLLGTLVAVVPTAALMNSLADSVQGLIHGIRDNTLVVPPPREGVEHWPAIDPIAGTAALMGDVLFQALERCSNCVQLLV